MSMWANLDGVVLLDAHVALTLKIHAGDDVRLRTWSVQMKFIARTAFIKSSTGCGQWNRVLCPSC